MSWICCASSLSKCMGVWTVGTETMKALSEHWKPIVVLLCLILLALALTTVKTRVAPQTSLLESAALSVVMPLQQVIASIAQRLGGFWQRYINLVQVRQECLRLQRQEGGLQGELTQDTASPPQHERTLHMQGVG